MRKKIFSVLVLTFLVASLSIAAESGDIVAAKNKPVLSHEEIAQRYDDRAKRMLDKITEEKQMLEDYELHSYYYGREGQDFAAHHEALLHKFEKAAERYKELATIHREMVKRSN
ncbi:MAG: hypothetical protein IPI97_11900 [Nitrosomonas sp.]|nr:hypothetical protein [Nitrosomonas sp.]MBK7365656.1 hypothetical protein [Nitrosomonas sp.]